MKAQIPATCVAAVIVTDGRVLLGRRAPSRTYYPDCWDLFGGHVEENESLVEALRRELLEELGLEIKSWRPLAVVHDPIEPSDIHMFMITDWVGQLATRRRMNRPRLAGFGRAIYPSSADWMNIAAWSKRPCATSPMSSDS